MIKQRSIPAALQRSVLQHLVVIFTPKTSIVPGSQTGAHPLVVAEPVEKTNMSI